MGKAKLVTLDNYKKLIEVEPYTVLEVYGGELVDSAFGKVALLNCVSVKDATTGVAAKKESFKLMAPSRFLPSNEEEKDYFPCVMVYMGKASSSSHNDNKTTHEYHKLRKVYTATPMNQSGVKRLALEYR